MGTATKKAFKNNFQPLESGNEMRTATKKLSRPVALLNKT
jgi:hypothetical protein